MLSRLIGEDIEVSTELDPEVPEVQADPGQIEQVIMNLVVNARDAMHGGGRLVIGTRSPAATQEQDRDISAQPSCHEVELWVSDTGCGIPATLRERIFEPFFTTKESGKGTGLGLSTVYGIVAQSEGRILLESEEGSGTTIRIRLPVCAEARRTVRRAHVVEDEPRGTETVLVAEDGAAVRRFVTRSLERQGYTVLAAAGGQEALALAHANARSIDLVLTDIVMPGMSGQRLIEQLRALLPGVPTIYMSGYTDDEIIRRGVLAPDTRFLQKPFTSPQLSRAVHEAVSLAKRLERAPAGAAAGR